jgi:hypothetical protein
MSESPMRAMPPPRRAPAVTVQRTGVSRKLLIFFPPASVIEYNLTSPGFTQLCEEKGVFPPPFNLLILVNKFYGLPTPTFHRFSEPIIIPPANFTILFLKFSEMAPRLKSFTQNLTLNGNLRRFTGTFSITEPGIDKVLTDQTIIVTHVPSSFHGSSISGWAKGYRKKFKKERGPKAPISFKYLQEQNYE